MPNPKFHNAPVFEAVCELIFPPEAVDLTVIGRLFDSVKKDYPIVKQDAPSIQVSIGSLPRMAPVVTFFDASQCNAIRITGSNISVHRLKPYDGWEAFLSRIVRALDAARATLSGTGVQAVQLRYLNRLEIGASSLEDLHKFVKVGLYGPIHNAWQLRALSQSITEVQGDIVRTIVLGSEISQPLQQPEIGAPLILDIRCGTVDSPVDVSEWLISAHDALFVTFKGCLTDRLLKQLNAKEEA